MHTQTSKRPKSDSKIISCAVSTFEEGRKSKTSCPRRTFYLRFRFARNACACTSARSSGFYVIWVRTSSNSSSLGDCTGRWFVAESAIRVAIGLYILYTIFVLATGNPRVPGFILLYFSTWEIVLFWCKWRCVRPWNAGERWPSGMGWGVWVRVWVVWAVWGVGRERECVKSQYKTVLL